VRPELIRAIGDEIKLLWVTGEYAGLIEDETVRTALLMSINCAAAGLGAMG